MKKNLCPRVIVLVVSLCMCYLFPSLVAADSWAESVEYYADDTESYEEYGTDEDESDEWDEVYEDEEYYSDDEISDYLAHGLDRGSQKGELFFQTFCDFKQVDQ